jgi:hypothetical protein
MTLKQIQSKNDYSTDKESTHHYLDVYDKLFKPFKTKNIVLMEVGYGSGGSIRLWEDYFKSADILCIDREGEFQKHSDRVVLAKLDINSFALSDYYGMPVDIAIDDGSHYLADQIAFICLVWPFINKNGLMIIEDVHDIEKNKKYFDELNIPFEIIDLRNDGIHCSVLLIFRK